MDNFPAPTFNVMNKNPATHWIHMCGPWLIANTELLQALHWNACHYMQQSEEWQEMQVVRQNNVPALEQMCTFLSSAGCSFIHAVTFVCHSSIHESSRHTDSLLVAFTLPQVPVLQNMYQIIMSIWKSVMVHITSCDVYVTTSATKQTH
jgi:hypothetical protein